VRELVAPLPPELVIALGAALAAWLLGAGWATGRRRRALRRERVATMVEGRRPEPGGPRERSLERLRQAVPGTARPLARTRLASLEARLERAGLDVEPHRFIIMELGAAALGFALGAALLGTLAALAFALLALPAPVFLLRRRRSAKIARINDQLPELLQLVAGSLQAGQSFLQALDHAADELGEPFASELRMMLRETDLGVSLEEALEGLRTRVPDDDLSLVVDAVMIQRRVGGNLAEVLGNIAHTIRERIRIRGEVHALTGQARLSGWVLSGLPVALAGVLGLLNPEYMAPLFLTPFGRLLLVGAFGSEVIGMLMIRRIANVRV
jgi:tight adherence protein B